MFKTSGRASFLIKLFQFLQYYVFVVLSGDAFSPTLLLRLLHQRRRLHTKPSLHSNNVWQLLGVCCVSWPSFIANLSDGLEIMDPGFITCDEIGKLLFVIIWKHLRQLFGQFNPLPLLLISQQMWHSSSRNLSAFQMLLQNKVNR